MPLQDKNINRDFLKTIRYLNSALIDLEEMYENNCDCASNADVNFLYTTYCKIENALYCFGKLVFEEECNRSDDNITPCNYPDDFSQSELVALKNYLSNYCSESSTPEYKLEKFGNSGYKAILPFLLSRRATRGLSFFPKRKYIYGIFRNLLESEKNNLKRLESATVIIVCYSPAGKRGLRDNDNSDAHDIINLINDYLLLQDDNGTYLNVFYDASESDSYYTEVYIIPKIEPKKFVDFQSNISP